MACEGYPTKADALKFKQNADAETECIESLNATFITPEGQTKLTITGLSSEFGWRNAGLFSSGFTYESARDYGVDSSGAKWVYNGQPPFAVAGGTVPSEPTYSEWFVNSHQDLIDRNPSNGSAHNADDIGRGASTVDADLSLLESQVIKASNPISSDTAISYSSFNDYIAVLAGKMSAGEVVKIGCYGDSTTDGFKTTGWTANPVDGSGDAIGNSNHNISAPNAWPVKLQSILREVYSNNNITTFNAGYANQKMSDGWANANYQAAMIDNPFYGTPDVLFIQFGINDTVDAGSSLSAYIDQYRIFLRRVIDDGTTPVIMTSDAYTAKPTGSFNRPARECQRELNSACKSLSREFNVPIVDMYEIERKWLQDNTDGYSWRATQPDTVHLEDDGHSFKAQIPAMLFFNDAAEFSGGEMYINSFSSQCSSLGDNGAIFSNANNKQGGVYTVSGLANDTDLMTMWVWSTSADAQLVYLGFATEGLFVSTLPSIDVKNYITLSTVSKEIPSADGNYVASTSKSDIPYIFGKLHYGLNKVVYKSSDASQAFTGGFKLVSGRFGGNCLKDTGLISNKYTNATGVHFVLPSESSTLDNVSSMFDGEDSVIKFKANIPIGCGIILSSGSATDGTSSAVANNLQCSTLLLRSASDTLKLQNLFTNNLGVITDITVDTISGLTLSDATEGSIRIYKDAGIQKVDLYDSFSGGSLLGTFTAPSGLEIRYGGVCGGLFANTATPPGVDVLVEISEMVIVR